LASKPILFAGSIVMQNHRPYWDTDNINTYNPSSGSKNPSENVAGIPLTQQLKHANNQNQPLHFPTRGSLGQFIERSTSAPPLSSISAPDDDAAQLLENVRFVIGWVYLFCYCCRSINMLIFAIHLFQDLYEYVSKGYNELSLPDSEMHRKSSGSNASSFGAVHVPGGMNNDDSGRVTAPTTNLHNNDFLFQMTGSAKGMTSSGSPCTPIGGGRSISVSSNSSSGHAVSRPLSASGDGALYQDFLDANSDFCGVGLQRSQSAAPSLRSPPGLPFHHSAQTDSFAGNVGIRRPASVGVATGYFGNGTVRPAAKTLMDLIQEDMPPEYEQKNQSPHTSNFSEMTIPAYAHELRSPNADLKHVRSSSLQGQPQPDHHQTFRVQRDEHVAEGFFYPQDQKKYPEMEEEPKKHLQQNHAFRPKGIDEEPILATMYMQQPLSQAQIHGGQHSHVYYGGQQIGSMQGQGMQPSSMHMNRLQGQVLPNGQAVYLNAGPTQHAYSYSTVQYQPPHHQQAHIVHHAMSNGQQDQFVSVLPIQNGGAQMSYWQPSGMVQQQQVLFPTANLIALGNQVTTNDSVDSSLSYQMNNRLREKGGRIRRGSGARVRGGDVKNSVPTSSVLLEEFRSAKSRDWTMRRIEGYVVEFCQDQSGSRFIQQRLEMGDHVEQQIVMKEVLPAIRRLRNDVFGNYVIQKLLDFGTSKMKSDIRDTLEGEMLPLSLQVYGCRVVQKALEALDEEDLPRLLQEFRSDVINCIHDQNGNHVIQKCIEILNCRANKADLIGDTHRATFLREQIDFVLDDVLLKSTSLACHPYGCRVLQRILEHCTEDRKTAILDEIKRCHKALLDDQYGNYVIQHVLQYGREEDRDSIVQIVVECGLLGLARQKFASNVVEKLLKYGNGDQRRAVVREMLKVSFNRLLAC
jgi:pumilio RNA-binding family